MSRPLSFSPPCLPRRIVLHPEAPPIWMPPGSPRLSHGGSELAADPARPGILTQHPRRETVSHHGPAEATRNPSTSPISHWLREGGTPTPGLVTWLGMGQSEPPPAREWWGQSSHQATCPRVICQRKPGFPSVRGSSTGQKE